MTGKKVGRKEWSSDIKNHAKDLYLRGWTFQRISNKLGVPLSTVARWSKKYGWKEERKRRQIIDMGAQLIDRQQEVPSNMAEQILSNWVEKGRIIDDLLDRISALAKDLDSIAKEQPKELSRAVWALSEALKNLLNARAEERQFLKLVVEAKIAALEQQSRDHVIKIEVVGDDT